MPQGALSIAWIVLMIGLFYFLLIRPQKKKTQKLEDMRNSLKVGDKVTTIGGVKGKITVVKEDEIHIEIAKDVVVTMMKWSISEIN